MKMAEALIEMLMTLTKRYVELSQMARGQYMLILDRMVLPSQRKRRPSASRARVEDSRLPHPLARVVSGLPVLAWNSDLP
jgi:hypothetical protein